MTYALWFSYGLARIEREYALLPMVLTGSKHLNVLYTLVWTMVMVSAHTVCTLLHLVILTKFHFVLER
jgi:hypothetical protein